MVLVKKDLQLAVKASESNPRLISLLKLREVTDSYVVQCLYDREIQKLLGDKKNWKAYEHNNEVAHFPENFTDAVVQHETQVNKLQKEVQQLRTSLAGGKIANSKLRSDNTKLCQENYFLRVNAASNVKRLQKELQQTTQLLANERNSKTWLRSDSRTSLALQQYKTAKSNNAANKKETKPTRRRMFRYICCFGICVVAYKHRAELKPIGVTSLFALLYYVYANVIQLTKNGFVSRLLVLHFFWRFGFM